MNEDTEKIEISQREYNLKEIAFNTLQIGEAEFVKRIQENEKKNPNVKVPSTEERLKEAYLFCISEGSAGSPIPQHFPRDLLRVCRHFSSYPKKASNHFPDVPLKWEKYKD